NTGTSARSPSNTTAQKTGVATPAAQGQAAALPSGGVASTGTAAGPASQFPYRLSNTDRSLTQLGRSDTAILLENALIDTASPAALAVPAHLRVSGDTGSYLVQWRWPLDNAFYARLREVG